jgi:EPS-associated MarR family transcriptional regulator
MSRLSTDAFLTKQVAGPAIDGEAAELAILRLLQDNPALSQREVSKALGLSLGKTHYLLRALLEKGSIKVRNFQRSDNKVAYMYLLTPNGVRKRLSLTRTFLRRKESEFVTLQETIARLRSELNRPEGG